ncbi:hypothetical protein Pmani_021240 [Petrolisthes manimaculis]|uniref:Heme-binding protein 2 n=1 Tax=Petrolisthes manimaculis TaxID=1843537 RepID=A0AAE1U1V3_9EUCA|nr:hypothetical protein Pmani_021240 [Petrolisthes manimaculis]
MTKGGRRVCNNCDAAGYNKNSSLTTIYQNTSSNFNNKSPQLSTTTTTTTLLHPFVIMARFLHLALFLQVCVLGWSIEMPPYQVLNTTAGPNCENTFTESFYVPSIHQDNPPKPTNPDVYIEERPELHVFSRRFHGFTNDQDWITNAAQLAEDLLTDGMDEGVNFSTYYTAGYDSPFSIFNRTNEVWLMKM